jgi:hypothetical protein
MVPHMQKNEKETDINSLLKVVGTDYKQEL